MGKILEFLQRKLEEIPWSESERAYRAQLQERPKLSDDEFFEQFYAGNGIPRDIPIRLRQLYAKNIGDDLTALRPEDNHALIYDELDFADVIDLVGREFNLKIPIETVPKWPLTWKGQICEQGEIDGTFDSVVRYVAKALQTRSATADQQ